MDEQCEAMTHKLKRCTKQTDRKNPFGLWACPIHASDRLRYAEPSKVGWRDAISRVASQSGCKKELWWLAAHAADPCDPEEAESARQEFDYGIRREERARVATRIQELEQKEAVWYSWAMKSLRLDDVFNCAPSSRTLMDRLDEELRDLPKALEVYELLADLGAVSGVLTAVKEHITAERSPEDEHDRT